MALSDTRPPDSASRPRKALTIGAVCKILESELRREETKLAEMQKEFNNGEPERQGGERNYQKYLDRVEEMKAALARKQSDVAALKRELSKFPASKE